MTSQTEIDSLWRHITRLGRLMQVHLHERTSHPYDPLAGAEEFLYFSVFRNNYGSWRNKKIILKMVLTKNVDKRYNQNDYIFW